MRSWLTLLLVMLLCIFPSFLAHTKSFELIIGTVKPPYILEQMEQGYEIELVTKLLASMGINDVKVLSPDYGLRTRLFNKNIGDGIITVNENLVADKKMLTNPYITYENVAITLKNRAIKLSQIQDLSGYRVYAFEPARLVLGGEFRDVVDTTMNYQQTRDQASQVRMLYAGRIDVSILDVNIFNYLNNSIAVKADLPEIKIHRIFPKNHYSMAFKNVQLVDDFNKALIHFKTTKEYEDLQRRYSIITTVQ